MDDQEVGFVMGRGGLAVAVKLGETPYGFLGRLQAFNGSGKSTGDLAKELCAAFITNPLTREAMAPAVLDAFEKSGTWAQAARQMDVLEVTSYWKPEFGDRIRTALSENSQIKESWVSLIACANC